MPQPIGHQIICRLQDGRVLAPGVSQRRALARTVMKHALAAGLLVFRCVDTHLHLAVTGPRQGARRLCQTLQSALKQRLGFAVGFLPADTPEIQNQHHLYRLIAYILDQERHHGVVLDPYHEASSLPDLLGMRITGRALLGPLRQRLPRLKGKDLLPYLGPHRLHRPISDHRPLAQAAAAAVCLPHLQGKAPLAVAARSAAVHLAAAQGLRAADICDLLSCPRRTINWLRARPADPQLLVAVDRQLRMRQPLQPGPDPPLPEHALQPTDPWR